jgi:hypothetical protein
MAKDKEILANYLENYTARLWKPEKEDGKTAGFAKFTKRTPRQKQRTLESILEGWAKGKELQVTSAINAQLVASQQIAQVIHDRNLLKEGQKAGVLSTHGHEGWTQVEHPNFTSWVYSGQVDIGEGKIGVGTRVRPAERGNVGTIQKMEKGVATVHFPKTDSTRKYGVDELAGKIVRPYGRNFIINDDGTVLEQRAIYAPDVLAKRLNNILGTSKLNGIPIFDVISKYNALFKQTILFTSLFHHQAFLRSYMYGTPFSALDGYRPVKAYKDGRKAIENFTPEVQDLVRGGLTIGKIQDFDEMAARESNLISETIDKVPGAKQVKDALVKLRDQQTEFLFHRLGPNLKVMAGLLEYRSQLKEHKAKLESGELSRHEIAKRVADLINDDFGGLNLPRLGRNPTTQHIFRLLALAPDWTESNVRSMVKAIKGGKANKHYREFWARIIIKAGVATTAFNFLMSAFDMEDDEDAGEAFWRRTQTSWKVGNLRWLETDITPL